jgi:hypothetical protein
MLCRLRISFVQATSCSAIDVSPLNFGVTGSLTSAIPEFVDLALDLFGNLVGFLCSSLRIPRIANRCEDAFNQLGLRWSQLVGHKSVGT